MIRPTASYALAFGLMASPLVAMTLPFPAPVTQTALEEQTDETVQLPKAAYDGATVPMLAAQGHVTRQAWRLAAASMTTQQILAPLRAQLQADGFTVLFECQDQACGGYDFRFAADVLGEPAMHVDLGDFRYVLAKDAADVTVALLVSKSSSNGFVQLTRVGGNMDVGELIVTSTKSSNFAVPVATGPLLAGLAERGHVALDDLLFQTGSSKLDGTDFPSLQAVAAFMADNPDKTITLVGHSDAEGALDGNISLSRRRAEAVRETLINSYGLAGTRLTAEGVGFLSPRANNTTDDGRRANRRVEIILNN